MSEAEKQTDDYPMLQNVPMRDSIPMLDNILGQPASHSALLKSYAGAGLPVLEECASRIREAHGRVIFSGMGASLFAAMPSVSRLEQHGYPGQVIESAELLHYGTPALRSQDVGVLVSRSGGSVEVLRLAEKMHAAGMTVIAVTNVSRSPLEALADVTLPICAHADQLIAVQTYTGTVLTLLLLAEQVIAAQSARLVDLSLAALPLLTAFIADARRESEGWREWLDGPSPLYLLGRGPALASVHEGALLLHETAKTAAVGMSSGQFRHGPVEAVSAEFRAVVFGSPEATRETDRLLAADLVRMGVMVRWIGPSVGSSIEPATRPAIRSEIRILTGAQAIDSVHAGASDLLRWPEIAPELAPIFEIVPLQFAAYQLALWRGIIPGDFRFASEVTSTESGFPLLESRLAHK